MGISAASMLFQKDLWQFTRIPSTSRTIVQISQEKLADRETIKKKRAQNLIVLLVCYTIL